MHHDDHDVLFGNDWLDEMDAGIFPKRKILEIDHDHIRLNEDNELDNFEKFVDQMHQNIAELEEINEAIEISDYVDDFDPSVDKDWNSDTTIKQNLIEDIKKLDTNKELNIQTLKILEKEITKMTASSYEQLGDCKIAEHKIQTLDDGPIFIRPYR